MAIALVTAACGLEPWSETAGEATSEATTSAETTSEATTTTESPTTTTTGAEVDILEQLQAVEGLEVEEAPASLAGHRFFRLVYRQPADHDDPDGPQFGQRMTLLHRDTSAPLVMVTAGYSINSNTASPGEPAQLLAANQLTVEHRFFTPSRPQPADWATLAIAQAAADHHRIATALRPIYAGSWVATGASKGGMAALYFRRFYPDDVEATVAYVAPHSYGTYDPRYIDFVAQAGDPACTQALHETQRELLLRRPAIAEMMAAQATSEGLSYELLGIDRALESAVVELPFIFWQYFDAGVCDVVPTQDATDTQLWAFLDNINSPTAWSDDSLRLYEPYYWQAATQLGYPATDESDIADLLLHPGLDVPKNYLAGSAGAEPVFDPAPMLDVADWLASEGRRMLFIYGENDPWSAGAVELGAAEEAYVLVAPEGNHGAWIADLAPDDRALAMQALADWTGVTPRAAVTRPAEPLRERMLLRGW